MFQEGLSLLRYLRRDLTGETAIHMNMKGRSILEEETEYKGQEAGAGLKDCREKQGEFYGQNRVSTGGRYEVKQTAWRYLMEEISGYANASGSLL